MCSFWWTGSSQMGFSLTSIFWKRQFILLNWLVWTIPVKIQKDSLISVVVFFCMSQFLKFYSFFVVDLFSINVSIKVWWCHSIWVHSFKTPHWYHYNNSRSRFNARRFVISLYTEKKHYIFKVSAYKPFILATFK